MMRLVINQESCVTHHPITATPAIQLLRSGLGF
jgi:hypothetical protein